VTATQIAWPLELDANGSFAEVEQDSADEIRRAGGLLCDTRPGQLPWNRLMGTPSPLGTNDPEAAAEAIEAALTRWETRAEFTVDVLDEPGEDDRFLHLTVDLEGV
jgi:hypothetical protein